MLNYELTSQNFALKAVKVKLVLRLEFGLTIIQQNHLVALLAQG